MLIGNGPFDFVCVCVGGEGGGVGGGGGRLTFVQLFLSWSILGRNILFCSPIHSLPNFSAFIFVRLVRLCKYLFYAPRD